MNIPNKTQLNQKKQHCFQQQQKINKINKKRFQNAVINKIRIKQL